MCKMCYKNKVVVLYFQGLGDFRVHSVEVDMEGLTFLPS